ncbi:hypothetical protein LTR27_009202 [Elasticomyces elasticus]|nr:hypothetical protein LTR27_009202 [Elasticomyces elasticus]
MPNFNTIAPELRLNIYEHLFSTKKPLKRILSRGAPSQNQAAHGAQSTRAITAILQTCRQIHDEALPMLYKAGTLMICHTDICTADGYARTSLSCPKDLLVHASLDKDKDECEDEPDHITCLTSRLPCLLHQFVFEHPKLQSLTIDCVLVTMANDANDVEGANDLSWFFTCEEVEDYLFEAGATVTYTGLTKVNITLATTTGVQHPTLIIQCAEVARTLDRMLRLSHAELEEASEADPFKARQFAVCNAFARAHAQLQLSADQLKIIREAGLKPACFDGKPLSHDMYGSMTSVFP